MSKLDKTLAALRRKPQQFLSWDKDILMETDYFSLFVQHHFSNETIYWQYTNQRWTFSSKILTRISWRNIFSALGGGLFTTYYPAAHRVYLAHVLTDSGLHQLLVRVPERLVAMDPEAAARQYLICKRKTIPLNKIQEMDVSKTWFGFGGPLVTLYSAVPDNAKRERVFKARINNINDLRDAVLAVARRTNCVVNVKAKAFRFLICRSAAQYSKLKEEEAIHAATSLTRSDEVPLRVEEKWRGAASLPEAIYPGRTLVLWNGDRISRRSKNRLLVETGVSLFCALIILIWAADHFQRMTVPDISRTERQLVALLFLVPLCLWFYPYRKNAFMTKEGLFIDEVGVLEFEKIASVSITPNRRNLFHWLGVGVPRAKVVVALSPSAKQERKEFGPEIIIKDMSEANSLSLQLRLIGEDLGRPLLKS